MAPREDEHEIAGETGRLAPERVVLGVREGSAPSDKPPVRIFLGTEPSQFRPERVLVWSIEEVRDPGRVYEIFLMRELEGFDRSRWTTGFTNYRFAIPDFAGRQGRAIYNDEDQIYLSDPGELFDLEMGEHGFLAIAPEGKVDSAVMLLDCARMSEVWTLEQAQREHKKKLLAKAREAPGLRGDLPPEWHARDDGYELADRFERGKSKLLHYTTLHTQPWHPDPSRFVYRENPHGALWHDLEQRADAAGFQCFSRARPSARHRRLLARGVGPESKEAESPEWQAALAELEAIAPDLTSHAYDPLTAPPAEGSDLVACRRRLEALASDDLPWVLDEIFSGARRAVLIEVDGREAPSTNAGTATRWETAAGAWPELLEAASRRHPCVHWHLVVHGLTGATHVRGGPVLAPEHPLTWMLCDDAAEESVLRGLAAELGVDAEVVAAQAKGPPWPDLVLASGERSVSAARRIRSASSARSRAVALGPGAGAITAGLDLVITPVSQGFYPDARRLETCLPLPRFESAALDTASGPWRKRFEEAAEPRIVLLIEGAGGVARIDSKRAELLALEALLHARQREGSLFACLGSGLPEALCASLTRALGAGEAHVESCEMRGDDGVYLAHLALSDSFLVMADEEQAIADACATGRPVSLYPIPEPPVGLGERLRRWVAHRAEAPRLNDRGTIRPQQGMERLCSRLIAEGRLSPPRRLDLMRARLDVHGAVTPFADPSANERDVVALRERERVAQRIRERLGL